MSTKIPIMDYSVLVPIKNDKKELLESNSLDEIINEVKKYLEKHDFICSNILFFYKKIEVGVLEVSYYDMMGIKYPRFKVKINEDSLQKIFEEYCSAPLGDEWDWKIYKFKQLENMYLFIDGEYISSYEFLYNEDFQSMSKQKISEYLIQNYF